MKKYKAIAKSYARLIKHGRKTFQQVPKMLKETVEEILEEQGLGYLTI